MYRQDLSLPASLGLDNGVYALMARTYLLRLALAIVGSPARPNPLLPDEGAMALLAIPQDALDAWYIDDSVGPPPPIAYLEAELSGSLQTAGRFAATPLGCNLTWLADETRLNGIEREVLQAIALCRMVPQLAAALAVLDPVGGSDGVRRLLAILCGRSLAEIRQATGPGGRLAHSGLFFLEEEQGCAMDHLRFIDGLQEILGTRFRTRRSLMCCFYRLLPPGRREARVYDFVARDFELIQALLEAGIRKRRKGVNILVHGAGAEALQAFAQQVAAAAGLKVLALANRRLNPLALKGDNRVSSLLMSHRAVERRRDTVLLVEGPEDFTAPQHSSLDEMINGHSSVAHDPGQAWVFRMLEKTPVPTIWTAEKLFRIAPVYLERFDYILELPARPKVLRQRAVEAGFAGHRPEWIDDLAGRRELTPAQIRIAARSASLVAPAGTREAEQAAERILANTAKALRVLNGSGATVARRSVSAGYRLDYLNTSLDLAPLIARLRLDAEGAFCFYGPPGTGKTALARYLADEIDRPLLVKHASDLLAKYVGESEHNIAAMFAEAQEQGAILVLDEADSFLNDRRTTENQWEVTQVNEMLCCMEEFEGVFICTTNLMDRIDPAALRRFAVKVHFDYLKPEQRLRLFEETWQRCAQANGTVPLAIHRRLDQLEQLTPGDFAAVVRQHKIVGTPTTPNTLLKGLEGECRLKGSTGRGVGFLPA